MTTTLTTLICFLIAFAIFVGAFYFAEYVVKKQHRVHVLEDNYNQAVEHIGTLEREILGLNQQLEQVQYEANLNEQRGKPTRAWNPSNPLNSSTSR